MAGSPADPLVRALRTEKIYKDVDFLVCPFAFQYGRGRFRYGVAGRGRGRWVASGRMDE